MNESRNLPRLRWRVIDPRSTQATGYKVLATADVLKQLFHLNLSRPTSPGKSPSEAVMVGNPPAAPPEAPKTLAIMLPTALINDNRYLVNKTFEIIRDVHHGFFPLEGAILSSSKLRVVHDLVD